MNLFPEPEQSSPYIWCFVSPSDSSSPSFGVAVSSGANEFEFVSSIAKVIPDQSFDVSLTVSAFWYANGTNYSATATTQSLAIVPKVTTVSFIGDAAPNEVPLDHFYLSYHEPIVDPVWEQTLTQTIPSKNHAAAYHHSTNARTELTIEAPEPLSQVVYVEVQGIAATADGENFYPQSAAFHEWLWQSGELQLPSSPLKTSVNHYSPMRIQWEYRVGSSPWILMNETEHRIYTINQNPTADPVFDLALEYATSSAYAQGLTSVPSICNKIAEGIAADIIYDPSVSTNQTYDLDEYDQGGTVCEGNAELMKLLVESVSSSQATVKYFWGGSSSTTRNFFLENFPDDMGMASIRMDNSAANDKVGPFQHFNYHAITRVNGADYDPSFGVMHSVDRLAKPNDHWYNLTYDPNSEEFVPGQYLGTNSPSCAVQYGNSLPTPQSPTPYLHIYHTTP